MRKTNLVVLCSIGSLTWTGPALADGESPIEDTKLKVTYCLLPEEIGKIEPPRDIPDHAIKSEGPKYPCKKQILLSRDNHTVALVRVELDGTITLNPQDRGFVYGKIVLTSEGQKVYCSPIPALQDMSQSELDRLWGTSSKSIKDDVITYKLTSYLTPPDVYVDIQFKDNKIQKYRIRSPHIETQTWNLLK